MADVIQDPKLREFVHTSISDDFGLSVAKVAEKCKGYGRFSAWLNGDITRVIEVLIKVRNNGVSPAFFASYEKTEGYNSSWGWLNHTSVNGDPINDADSVSKWVAEQSTNTTDNPAWIDQGNPKDFVPQDVKTAGNADFKNMSSGSIGKVVIAGTAAATWEVYYPKGLLKEYNGVQDYGKPITGMMETIIEWGGNIDGGSPHFIFPLNEPFRITQEFKPGVHFGIDMAGENPGDNVDIMAVADGTVSRSYVSDSYGEVIFIKHEIDGKKYESVYAHMVTGSRKFQVGDSVKQGDVIGITGNTGASEGVHLHFELHQPSWNDAKSNAVDPLDYLGKGGGGDEPDPPSEDNNLIVLWITDALNGWKF